jgi:amino acid adenylation domain-containing protein
MITKAIDILQAAKSNGVHIYLDKDQLQLKYAKGTVIDPQLLEEIKHNKESIIHFLRDSGQDLKKEAGNEIELLHIKRETGKRIPLSFSQERLWFIDRLGGSAQYHMPAVLRLKGKLNREALVYALQSVVNRHEVARTVFNEEEGRVYQTINSVDGWKLSIVDGSAYKENSDGLKQYVQQLINQPFDLSKDYMLRANLVAIDANEHLLVVTMHHIASDGWSKALLVKDVLDFYKAYEKGRQSTMAPLPLQYADFASWQRNYLSGDTLDRKLGYWKDKLEGAATLQLPTDFARPAIQSTRGASVSFAVDKALALQLQELSRQQGATLFMTLLTVYKILLYRYSAQEDICVGSPIAGRKQQELEGLIGFFANTIVFRSEIKPAASFIELLKQVRRTTIEAQDNQEVPFEKVVDAVVKERSLSRNPLVQVMFSLQNTPEIPELHLGNLQFSREGHEHTTSTFDIIFFINETPNGFSLLVEYSTDIYSEPTIRQMAGHYKELLSAIVRSPLQSIGLLPMLTGNETQQLLIDFNQTQLQIPADQTVIGLFESVAEKTPGAIALLGENETLTYGELNRRANQLAHYLADKGVKEETLVPVCMNRSVDLIVSILGILKCGGAYVPIDPGYPQERISYMLQDTGASIMLSSNEIIAKLSAGETLEAIAMDGDRALVNSQPVHNLNIGVKPQQLANVIYTSGSTGKPKGVLIEYKGLLNLVVWHNLRYKVDAFSRATTMAGVGFDAFGWEVWPYLAAGASLLIIDDETRLSPFKLLTQFNTHQVTHSFMATALVQDFVNISRSKTGSLKCLLTGGDKLSSIDIEGIGYTLVNNYGPTENTVVTTSYELKTTDNEITPPIGSPVSNTSIYILNNEDGLVPVGVAGEICISGDSLARGYLNREDLTEEKFVSNPFSKTAGTKMYRTGDIGRWLRDGNIEYLGRKDDQVKIRGYRIELGEIESVLQQTGLVSQAVVLAKQQRDGNKTLLGYMVPDWGVVKAEELELYRVQIAGWKELYENEYSQTEGVEDIDVEFNIIGWNDSFTKEPIPAEHMKQWVDDIVSVILSKQPERVLEIGSGTGLIYYQLAGKLKKYIGTDFSRSSMNQIAERISKGSRDYGETELVVTAAHEINIPEDEMVDTIILNSIVQYFPGEDYMNSVIEKAIAVLKGRGRIIVGDVRDNRLLSAFKGRLYLQRMQPSGSAKEFNWAVSQEVMNEEELCFSPEYFYRLQLLYPLITHIDIQWKNTECINELSLYRYTVIIYVGIEQPVVDPQWQNWDDKTTRNNIDQQLQEQQPLVAIRDVPNPRLWKERQLARALNDKRVLTAADISNAIENEDVANKVVWQLMDTAKLNGYGYRLLLDEDPLKVNLLFERQQSGHFITTVYGDWERRVAAFNTNIPLFTDIMLSMQKDILSLLQQRLPEYMVPAGLIALPAMPLTNNGKVDRSFLSRQEDKAMVSQLNYKPPRTKLETTLASIWQSLLHLDKVGIEDNFFELGGHSLLLMRLISAVRRELGVELSIKDLFIHTTISELASHLEGLGNGAILPAIESVERPARIPLSFSQERLWFIDRLEGSLAFHVPAVFKLTGRLNQRALSRAFETIVTRHEVLRTVFLEEDGYPYQLIKPANAWQLNISDGAAYAGHPKELNSHIKKLLVAPFNLSADLSLRADLLLLTATEHVLVVTLHHIAADAWSVGILVKEVVELYNAFTEDKEPLLPVLPIQYADYAIWQRNYLTAALLSRKLNYWKEKLQGVEPLQLPTDFARPPFQSTKGTTTVFTIDKHLSDQLKDLSQQNESTLFMTLLAAFKVLLHHYSGQLDICVGTSIAGRQQQETEDLIGFFVNVLALRTHVDPALSFSAFIEKIRQTTLEAYEHQEVPFEKVVDAVVKERDTSRSPLFQVLFVMLNTPLAPETALGDLMLSRISHEQTSSKYDITFFVTENSKGLSGSVEYSTELFSEHTIAAMMAHFAEILYTVVQNPQQKLKDINLLSSTEQKTLLEVFNNTGADYPLDKTIVELFNQQALLTPNNIAVIFGDEELTYEELQQRSNALANYLIENGTSPGTNIGLLSYRGIEMIIGMFGILKAGCAYVPFNTEYPAERLGFIIADAGIRQIVYTSHELLQSIGLDSFDCIHVNDSIAASSQSPNISMPADSCAYIMFTSGTTGRPKGIAVSQRNIIKLVYDAGPISVKPTDRILQWSNYSFDGSTYDIYSSLLKGAAICMIKDNQAADVDALSKCILEQNITVCFITTALFNTFIDVHPEALKGLRKILFGGEMVSVSHVKKALSMLGQDKIVHVYGPTETTVYASSYAINHVPAGTSIPIGKPLSNTSFFVLNNDHQLVPVGVPGELFIGGAGVSLGYINNTALTAEKFIQNPFTKNSNDRLYRSGDIVRWLLEGDIEYLGRIDDQVKIRGFRIELGEIESVLQGCDLVRHAAVIAKTDTEGTKRLVGYVVANGIFDKQAIQNYLSNKLPEYMVPALLVEMESLPLNTNGKIDRKALPDPDTDTLSSNQFVAPGNNTEKILAGIWQDLLGLDEIGIHDNFFEIGGDSLLAIRVVSAIRKQLEIEMPIGYLFEHQTIASLAKQAAALAGEAILPAIVTATRPEQIPLSFSQERLWFIDRLEGTIQYHIPTVIRLKGELNSKALEHALQSVINRHEVLRTVFLEKDGEAYQSIKDKAAWPLPVIDGELYFDDREGLQQLVQKIVLAPFDLSKDNMLRAALIQLQEQEHVLVVTLHHIASDGWSRSILVKEVVESYSAFNEERDAVLTPLPIQYADFAIWQRNYLQGTVLDKKMAWWQQQLQGIEPLEMPTDFPRPAVQSSRGASMGFAFDRELSAALQQLSQQQGTTLFMTLLSALKVLLYRYTSQEDICVGTGIAGRQQQEVEGLIGFFINTLALRTSVNPDQNFNALLQQVRTTTLKAYDHQEVPFEKVVDAVIQKRDRSRNPLFQVMFVLQNTPDVPNLQLGKLQLNMEGVERTTAQFDLSFSITEFTEGLSGSLEYNTDLYTKETIERLLGHFHRLVITIINEPQKKISELTFMSVDEVEQVLVGFNANETIYPADKTITTLFEEQVAATPDAIAIVFEGQQLTYGLLNKRANRLAHYLQAKGLKAASMAAISMDRSIDMMVAILGVLKAGGAYVPIDIEYPSERIRFMLEDTNASILLTNNNCKQKLPVSGQVEIICLDSDGQEIDKESAGNPVSSITPESLAYIIYTSGSTGKPKGVMVTQQNVVSLVKGVDYVVLTNNDILLSTGSSSFDATTLEYWGMLLNGGRLVLCSEQVLLDNQLLKTVINNNKVNRMWFTAGWFNQLVEADITLFENLTTALVGGEKLSEHHIERLRQAYPAIEIINGYGPTENTTFSLTYRITEKVISQAIPVGRPLNNRSALILDKNQQPVPVGVSGEICLSGAGLSRGYLNQLQLTAEKFVPHPFSKLANTRMYKTGDIGRWLPGGNIEYLGRVDEQVKIRGYRIELGEIEKVLQETSLVSQAVVIAWQDHTGNKMLVGYIVPSGLYNKNELNIWLQAKLPAYMIPAIWIELENLPLTPNGKIDRKALPDPVVTTLLTGGNTAPVTELQSKLVSIWQQILPVDRIGITDNFFELGGHSLLAMRLLSAVRKELRADIAVKDLFAYPTIAALATFLQAQEKLALLPPVEANERPTHIPLSFSQERLWFVDQLEGSIAYNSPTVLRLKGNLNQAALEYAIQNIIGRHEVLRSVFYEADGRPFQSVIANNHWKLSLIDGSSYRHDGPGLQRFIEQLVAAPFDLSKDYMLRAHLVEIVPQDYVLVVTMHHIASDGWSLPIIVKEVVESYNAFIEGRSPSLDVLPLQYADYAIWQRKYLEGEVLDQKTGYWKSKLDGVPALQLSTDFNRPAVRTTQGASVNLMIEKELADQLNELSRQQSTTLYMTLLAVYKVMLNRYSGQQDICVGASIANRPQQELEGLIGFFVNTLALRTTVDESLPFTELLQQVKTTMLEAYEHQDVPFERVVETVVKERDPSRSPLFQVMLVLLNTPESTKLGFGEVELSNEAFEINISKFDITFHVMQSAHGLPVSIVYNTGLFREDTINRMAGHFKQLLTAVVKDPQQNIDALQMLTEAEEQQLLVEFN